MCEREREQRSQIKYQQGNWSVSAAGKLPNDCLTHQSRAPPGMTTGPLKSRLVEGQVMNIWRCVLGDCVFERKFDCV